MAQSTSVSVDTETNFTDRPNERFCLGISVATDKGGYYIPVGHEDWVITDNLRLVHDNLKVPENFLQDVKGTLIFHNAKFDIQVLEKLGIKVPTGNMWDTMMMSHYINENQKHEGGGHSLDGLAGKYLGKRKEVELAKVFKTQWTNIPAEMMDVYASADAILTRELYPILDGHMDSEWKELWQDYDRDFLICLMEMENLGLPIDRELCAELEAKCDLRMKEIRQLLGFDPAKPSQLHPKLFDEPPFGLGLPVPSRTPSSKTHPNGQPQVPGDWLLAVGHPVCALVYEYRKLGKQKSSYFSAYLNLTTRDYARLHCTFKQHGTVTGRSSCEIPNLHQIPREEYGDAKVKEVFDPETNCQLWEIDFRALEYRLTAVYSQEPRLLSLFRDEGDFHQLIADDLSIGRHKAKTFNYATGYGAGVQKLATVLGVSNGEAKKIRDKYRASYPRVFRITNKAAEECEESGGQIRMWSGRTRHFAYPSEYHKAFNSVIQGGGFEIVKRSILLLREAGYRISNQVHDSVWINVKDEGEVIEAQKIMEDWTEPAFGLRFSTDRKLLKKCAT